MFPFLVGSLFSKELPLLSRPHSTKSQVMSLVQILPLHLAQVGWGSRSNLARKAPHFLAPTPGQILNSLDITESKKRKKENTQQKRKYSSTHPPNVNKKSSRRQQQVTTGARGLHTPVVEQRMTAEPRCWGEGGCLPPPPANYWAGN